MGVSEERQTTGDTAAGTAADHPREQPTAPTLPHAEPAAQRPSRSTQDGAAAPRTLTNDRASFDCVAAQRAQDEGRGGRASIGVQPGEIVVGGLAFLADPAGTLFHEGESTLLVADLHLEKGSSFARRGMMLPPYDTVATLAALAVVLARYRPRRVIALGDSFHDPYAASRLSSTDLATLKSLQAGRDWLWITGNHDPLPPEGLAGDVTASWLLGSLTLRHEPQADPGAGEIAGHLHPVARVVGTTGSTRRRCFLTDGHRCIMPAFGAYAGGLNIHHAAYAPLFGARPRVAHALGRDRIYPVPHTRCIPDGEVELVRYTAARRSGRG